MSVATLADRELLVIVENGLATSVPIGGALKPI